MAFLAEFPLYSHQPATEKETKMLTYLQLGDLGEDVPAEVSYDFVPSRDDPVSDLRLKIFGQWRSPVSWGLTEPAQDRIITQIIERENKLREI
jgi:hypothetical protein